MCALAVAVALFDFGCSLSFDTGPLGDGGLGDAPQNDTGTPDDGSTSGNDSGGGKPDGGAPDTGTPAKPQPPQFIGKSTASPSESNGFLVSKPAQALQGDLLLASIYVDDHDNVITAPGGWTFIDTHVLPTACSGITTWAYHFYSNSDPSDYLFGIKDARDLEMIAIMAYRGVDSSRPIGQHIVTEYKSTLLYGPVSLTTDQPNETLVMMSANKAGTAWTPPSVMSPRVDTGVLGVFDEPRANAGTTDPRTATSTGSASDSCGAVELVGLHPAPL